ncbi:MAG: MYXO-CTERM sorting domain-containing protein [Alphaproteobacteria bacterium]|nr:MYXO-CTERM sorting domain-containing protein [Alphaproteobacteria bacterium]
MRRLSGLTLVLASLAIPSSALAEVTLIDGSGLQFHIEDSVTSVSYYSSFSGVTYTYWSSASGAASDATYSTAVPTSTTSGGTLSYALTDMFDGYNGVAINGAPYYNNGAGTLVCSGRELQLNAQTIGDIEVQRRVYVPDDDAFARWLTIITNNGAASATVTMNVLSNMGSDSDTVVLGSSSGDTNWDASDDWFATGGDYYDPRATHVLQNGGATVRATDVGFGDYPDDLLWTYEITLDAGQTGVIMNLVSGQATNAAAVSRGQELVPLGPSATRCMTQAEFDQLLNFGVDCSELDDGECTTGFWNPEAGQCQEQVDPDCGGDDTGGADDTGEGGDDTGIGGKDEGCGCSSTPSPASGGFAALMLLGLVGLRRRR